ncbi:ArnT family glycosyltransferase [Tautonia plasticadhaerens]|uniref:Glycosyltransferase RgtA/B/C/D-like domain-containing protein n=1 Tax=Tautonia plasticadhaerens TaxID=2527974 RepID=A0A518GWR0_9BACT|nr:glycosyltransferase family 39 protein [Tautonia plasticadhaerens]QDV33027.1 hypothetical protein ElP_08690 [Tautonia plasticadhaerens]
MPDSLPPRQRIALAALLLATFGLRAWGADQPIVENYVGRQVPTAMVARNLQRGSGFLRPRLDTGPFPNLFLVEPPIYASAVAGLGGATGWPIGVSGRLVSALATTLGAWGLFGLVRRREGGTVSLLAVGVFATMPVMLRYGRAVQPDAMMIGTQLAAMRCWDAFASGRGRGWLASGWLLLATSLALKVTSAFVLVPLALAILGVGRKGLIVLSASAIVPALLWYLHAAGVLAEGEGSRASLDNGRIWLSALVPSALLESETYRPAARYLLVRAFTPIGLVLAVIGLSRGPVDRLWWIWFASAGLSLVALAGKWHHEYYWMVLAPVFSVGIARALAAILARGRGGPRTAGAAGAALLAMSAAVSGSTWRTPVEWRGLAEAAEAVRRVVPEGALVVAPEALLYSADRRGCRLELPPEAARRAAGEWGGRLDAPADPLALVEFYRARGASFLAGPGAGAGADPDPRRAAFFRAARARYRVRVDRPGAFVAELVPGPDPDDGASPHVDRRPP